MWTLSLLDFLQTDQATNVLRSLAVETINDKNHLRLAAHLRKKFATDETSVLLETVRLRQKAVSKFGSDAAKLFLTADALEQASHPLVVKHCRFTSYSEVIDLCCGIGTDSFGFARNGVQHVIGVDIDPIRVRMAQLNAQALGLDIEFFVGDATEYYISTGTIFFDPARRDDGKRIYHVEQYQPPLSTLKKWQASEVVVKLSPAVDMNELRDYNGKVVFVSVKGELKEALLHVGDAYSASTLAVVIHDEHVYRYERAELPKPRNTSVPLNYLLEPDPAVIRAGLVKDLAQWVSATQLDDQIAYLTSENDLLHPAIRAWRIREWMPYNLKALRTALRERNIGNVTVKKRGMAITPEELTAQLKLKGSESCTLVLTRHDNQPIVIICDNI